MVFDNLMQQGVDLETELTSLSNTFFPRTPFHDYMFMNKGQKISNGNCDVFNSNKKMNENIFPLKSG